MEHVDAKDQGRPPDWGGMDSAAEPQRDIEAELNRVMDHYAALREADRQKQEQEKRARLRRDREQLLEGKVRYECGPCENCARSILMERPRDHSECPAR